MIRVNCFVKLTDATKRADVIENAKALIADTLKNDEGCLGYDFFASTTRNDVFMFCETWTTQEALDSHSKTQHFIQRVGAIEKVGKTSIEIMELKK
jgi:quinol monooxygenase YgiN